jgi:hypothetical protein
MKLKIQGEPENGELLNKPVGFLTDSFLQVNDFFMVK